MITVVTLMVGVSAGVLTHSTKGPYYADTGFCKPAPRNSISLIADMSGLEGCWIGNNYGTEKVIFEYLWLWIAAFIMLVLYGLTALVMRGILVIKDESEDDSEGRSKLMWNFRRETAKRSDKKHHAETGLGQIDVEGEERHQAKVVANLMLL